MKIKVLLANGFEETEAITVIDILRRAGYDLKTVSIHSDNTVESAHGIKVIADEKLTEADFSQTELLFLPGGVPGVPNLADNEKVIKIVQDFHEQKKYLTAICAAPFVLDQAGVINDKNYTCYPSWRDKIKAKNHSKSKVVVDDHLITSQGVGTAILFGLKIVEILSGQKKSEELAKAILFNG
ncbi:MAG: DJ-1/PfpI family protein [Spirochaetes bacterium]|nr:DJ-1/PfpI family protein [Spirochaetota bacterium]